MNNELGNLEFGRGWPEQIIYDHAPYWRKWREESNISPISEEMYTLTAKYWIPFANGKNLGPALMREWVAYMDELMKKNGCTIYRSRRYHNRVKSYLRWLHINGAIDRDPGVVIKPMTDPPPKPKLIFTHEEYHQLTRPGNYLSWLITLGYHTGYSLGDCCNLVWDDVHIEGDKPSYIKIIRKKMLSRRGAGATAVVPIIVGSELWVWLKRWESEREPILGLDLVCGEAWEAYQERTVHHELIMRFRPYKPRSFRNLRNTFCSRLINSGTDAVLVAKMTGHSSLTQLADYVAPDLEAMQQAVLRGLRYAESGYTLPSRPGEESSTSLASPTEPGEASI